MLLLFVFFFSSRRRHTRCSRDWSSDVCSSDLHVSTKPRQRRTGAMAAAIASLIAVPMIASAPAAFGAVDVVSTCQQTGTIDTPDGQYTVQNNEWNSSAPQCVTYSSGTAWSVTTANFSLPTNGAPADYPSIFKGCHWGDCTSGSGLPIQVSNLGSATSSWS